MYNFFRLGMNFLVTGHSQNENDTAHSSIESKTKLRTLYTPAEWKTAIQMSLQSGHCFVSNLRSAMVVDFKDKNSFPEYTAILADSTTEGDEKFKIRRMGRFTGLRLCSTNLSNQSPRNFTSSIITVHLIGSTQLSTRKLKPETKVNKPSVPST